MNPGEGRAILPTAALVRAAETIRKCPLRWSGNDSAAKPTEILERGWFKSPGECSLVLSSLLSTEVIDGQAFGGPWPVHETGDWWIAPALPIPVGFGAEQGVDGEYHRREKTVWRETGGAEAPFLSVDETVALPGRPFDLIWFGDTERFTVVDGTLVAEDLFSVLRVGAQQAHLEKLLIRGRRLEPEVLTGIEFAETAKRAEIEVRRPEAATTEGKWRDPAALLTARADVLSVEQGAAELVVETVHGKPVVFAAQATPSGWTLRLIEGSYVFTDFALALQQDVLSLTATLDPSIDPLAPGMRGRLAFDLRSDLVALG